MWRLSSLTTIQRRRRPERWQNSHPSNLSSKPHPALALPASRGDILAFIDADCVAGADWIRSIEENVNAKAILGGDVRILHKDPARPTIWEAYESEYAFRMEHYIRKKGFTGTGNLAMRRDVFDAVGPFAGIGVAEDRDWGRRAGAKGFSITWAPTMLVFPPARDSFAELARKWDRHIAHDFQVQLDHSFGRFRWAALCIMMVFSPLGEAARIVMSDRIKGGPRGRLLAFLGLLRTRLYRAWRMSQLIFEKDASRLADRWREETD